MVPLTRWDGTFIWINASDLTSIEAAVWPGYTRVVFEIHSDSSRSFTETVRGEPADVAKLFGVAYPLGQEAAS